MASPAGPTSVLFSPFLTESTIYCKRPSPCGRGGKKANGFKRTQV
jgi:hypothetical protein